MEFIRSSSLVGQVQELRTGRLSELCWVTRVEPRAPAFQCSVRRARMPTFIVAFRTHSPIDTSRILLEVLVIHVNSNPRADVTLFFFF